jgi:hypothetical protein
MLNEYASVLSSEMNGQQGSDDSAASSEQDELLELEPEGATQAESNPQRPAKRDAGPHQSGLTPAPAKTLAIDETLADKDPGTSAATKGSDQDDFDEVLEVTDDFSESAMPVREQPTDTPSRPPPDALVDELEQVDVLSPAVDSGDQRGAGQTESLDEEWAKLLAEDPNTPESANLSAKAKKA